MSEHQRVSDLTAEEFERNQGRMAQHIGIDAVERALMDEKVDIGLYVKGRMVHTKTDPATVARIMAILTGLGE